MSDNLHLQQRYLHLDRLKRIEASAKAAETDVSKQNEFRVKFNMAEVTNKALERIHDDYLDYIMHSEDYTEASRKQEIARLKEFIAGSDEVYWNILTIYNKLFGDTTQGRGSSIRLPKLELPIFQGAHEDWQNWHDLFVSLVHNNNSVSEIEKFTYLLNSLREPALAIVKAIPLSAANYPIAFNALVKRYSNKRITAQKYWSNITQLPDKIPNTAAGIFKTINLISESLAALSQLGLPIKEWSFILFDMIFKKLDRNLCNKFEDTCARDNEFPTFDELKSFLENHAKSLEAVDLLLSKRPSESQSSSSSNLPKGDLQKSASSQNKTFKDKKYTFAQFNKNPSSTSTKLSCPCCSGSHFLFKCDEFKSKTSSDRHAFIKGNHLCYNCLNNHALKDCPSQSTCKVCQLKHHTLLHFDKPNVSTSNEPTTIIGTVTRSDKSLKVSNFNTTVLLSTALIQIRDVRGKYQTCRALIDGGSHASVISQRCLKRLDLPLKPSKLTVQWLNNITSNNTKGTTTGFIRSIHDSSVTYEVDFVVMNVICDTLPATPVSIQDCSHLEYLSLADPSFQTPAEVDILLGADIYGHILLGGIKKGKANQPIAIETTLGWILTGTVGFSPSFQPETAFCAFTQTFDLNSTMKQFWELETIPTRSLLSPEEELAESIFTSTHSRDDSGRYILALPFKTSQVELGNSYSNALSRFLKLEHRLLKNDSLRQEYHTFMKEYLNSGYMSLSDKETVSHDTGYYIPHHCVFKNSTTTRTRVVFDASCKTSNGVSLNDLLLTGPKLQKDLPSILLAFRQHAIAFTADLKAMFLQILIKPEHRCYQKILWRFDSHDPIEVYNLNTVIFGLSCSPYLAQRTIKQLALDYQKTYPLAVQVLQNDIYVDDVVSSCPSLEYGLKLQSELLELLSSAGFELRKWSSNDQRLLEPLPEHLKESSLLSLDKSDSVIKVLGMRWNPDTDCFSYKVKVFERSCTKRHILSEIARIFDPLGFLSPLTLVAKHMMQQLWTLGIGWDERPPDEISESWLKYKQELPLLSNLQIPRRAFFDEMQSCEIHSFCDASLLGYASVVYLRCILVSGEIKVSLLTAKSKVSPLKRITIPRLELCAALLNAELVDYVRHTYTSSVINAELYAYTDSSIALHWIKGSPHRFKTFVANKVVQIQEKVSPDYWHHIAGTANVAADCCSRGLLPKELLENTEWWSGPKWLYLPKESWPLTKIAPAISPELDQEEVKSVKIICATVQEESVVSHLLTKFSSFRTIQRILAYILRFRHIAKNDKYKGPLSILETNEAILVLIKFVQQISFSDEIKLLKSGKPCIKPIQKLSPFLDDKGILRVGGRLRNADLSFENKHPILLPKIHKLTEIIIEHYHKSYCHPGPQILQSILARQFWILSSKRVIQRCLSKCIKCFRVNPKPLNPPMGDLPAPRINQAKPFVHSGTDVAGPFKVTLGKHRGAKSYKAYLCVFICFVTKAIHLELMSDLSSDAFIAALRRFVGRRGRVSHIYSDCGTNFVGADRIIQTYLQNATEQMKIQFHFNPPSSPHMGGLWERSIRSIKNLLFRSIGSQILTFEELYTLFVQIEATINSRPLYPMSSNPNDLAALTPAHFLNLEPINQVPDEPLLEIPSNRLSRWQLLQQIQQSFWKRWSQEYLHTLQQRSKWLEKGKSIEIGSLVLIKDDNLPPLQWSLGRVNQIHPGADGTVRVVSIKTKMGVFKRPLIKLCPLPGHSM